jgi:HEAT repeat protein
MSEQEWVMLLASLRNAQDVDGRVAAAERMHKGASAEDIPQLKAMLAEPDFFIREAAAWPLSELAGPSVLADLLAAYQRGLDEGHDNDSFSAALIELAAAHRAETRIVLDRLVQSGNAATRANAEWLLEFCVEQPEA